MLASSFFAQGLCEFVADDVQRNFGDLTAFVKLSCQDLRLAGQHQVKAKLAKVIPLTRRGGFTVTTENPQVNNLNLPPQRESNKKDIGFGNEGNK